MESKAPAQLPHDNQRGLAIFAISFGFILPTIAVGLRFLCRWITRSKLYLDDYLIIIALVFKYGCSAGAIGMLYNGLGRHIWDVPPHKISTYMKVVYSGSFLYTLCITFIKLSIISFYKRLFPVKQMALAVNVVGAIVILWCFSVCLVGGLVCIPVNKLWDPTVPGGCLDLPKYYIGLQTPNIVTDAIILVMPIKVVWGLQMPKMQRVLLLGIFMVGGLTVIFDAIRLDVMVELSKKGNDVTYAQTPASAWTCIEAAVGIMAACMPSMRPLLTSFRTNVWSRLYTSRNSSTENSSKRNSEKDKSGGAESGKGSGSESSETLTSQ
ncbi:hypothetical protein FE257_003582 [Aspergillus nanangensis]|uniref:Rhodopsin domain-containing protein n=1 Tax=Aspergillus nanangensis TaxID=2582783 RepID=A0AAD4CRU4_ASPNN|nr:hypothetical protein FE257_003582 [Aspergillus nanangensis]